MTPRVRPTPILCAIALAGVIAPARGQGGLAETADAAPDAATLLATRLVQFYDFEDTDDAGQKIGQSLSDAPNWYPIGRDPQEADPAFRRQPLHAELEHRRHYPAYCDVRMDNQAAHSGDYAMLLGLRGGNVGAFVEVGAVPAVPGSDYQVAATLRTDRLQSAGAYLTAYFIDARGRRIPDTDQTVGPIRTAGKWRTVAVSLTGDLREAAWIGIEVQLLQPTPSPDHPLGDEQVILPDIRGALWFDDVAVWQLPHVRVATQSEVNIIRAPDRPEVSVSVRDLSGQRLIAEAVLYDDAMQPLLTDVRRVGAGSPGSWKWQPKLPGYGWYRVDLRARETEGPAAGRVIARTGGAFLYLPPDKTMAPADRSRFVLAAENASDTELALLDTLMTETDLHAALLSAFNPHATLGDLPHQQAKIDRAIERVLVGGRQLTLSLEPIPIELTQALGLDAADALAAARNKPDQWLSYFTPVVMRHGQSVRRWQVGSAREADAYFTDELPDAADQFRAMLHRLAPEPVTVLPWSLDQAPRTDLGEGFAYALEAPAGIRPEELAEYLEPWRQAELATALELAVPSAADVPQPRRATDLALRMLYAWEQQPESLALRRPWTSAGRRREALVPDPLLGVFTNVAHRLANRRVVGRLPTSPGVECLILDGPPGGMLAIWNRRAPQQTRLDMYLGASPVAIDLWGNRLPLPETNGSHQLTVTRAPIFIEGIDADLARFRAAFRLDPPFIKSAQGSHERTLTLANPFDRTISGKLTLTGPDQWRAAPTTHFFSIAAGRSVELPVALSFPISEVAGHKKLTARAVFRAEKAYDIDLATPIELGLPGIDFQATLALVPGQTQGTRDALVTAVITNEGENEVSLHVFAALAGHPRQERPIPALEPGESAVRSFRFTDAQPQLQQFPV
ncbi:MAG: hypothetical protein GVY24_00435, partial [Planctomycetes bacterium]|nr:hypothetical protein [Planctomycetota bacterium]